MPCFFLYFTGIFFIIKGKFTYKGSSGFPHSRTGKKDFAVKFLPQARKIRRQENEE